MNIDEVIRNIEEMYNDGHYTEETSDDFDKEVAKVAAIQALKQMQKYRWHSVSETLPVLEEGTKAFGQSKVVLCTLRWYDGELTRETGWYNQSGKWSNDSDNCKVIAWMPLPDCYDEKIYGVYADNGTAYGGLMSAT